VVSAHALSSVLTDRLPAICGSDTFTIVVSSTSMKAPSVTATAISQGFARGFQSPCVLLIVR
jgi:hypothetical protein